MAIILEDGHRTFGQQRMQMFRIFCLQKRILFALKNVDRHIQCREMWVDVFAAFWVPFEPLSDRANPSKIRSDIISDLLRGRTIIKLLQLVCATDERRCARNCENKSPKS